MNPAPVPAAGPVRLQRPLVVALIGLPGAGKSEVSRFLVARAGLRLLCRDSIRAALFPDCSQTLPEKRAAFRALLMGLEVNCAIGASSVLDGMTLARASDRGSVAESARRYGVPLLPIWLDVPPHVARERIEAQLAAGVHPAGDRVPSLVDEVLERFEPPGPEVDAIDATLPLAQVCDQALAFVLARGGVAPVS
jgi:predicted kinase